MLKKIGHRILLMVLGTTSFWAPVTLAAIATRKGPGLIVGSSLSSAAWLLSYFLVRRKASGWLRSVAFWMLMGIPMFGGIYCMIAFTAMGAGFTGLHGWAALEILLISLIPFWIASIGAAGLGNLPGFLLLVILVGVIHEKLEPEQPTNEGG